MGVYTPFMLMRWSWCLGFGVTSLFGLPQTKPANAGVADTYAKSPDAVCRGRGSLPIPGVQAGHRYPLARQAMYKSLPPEGEAPRIPTGLPTQERDVYARVLDVVAKRSACGAPAPVVIVFSDIGKDYDDLAALLIYKELNRLGAIELAGVVTNLNPAAARARLARGALNLFGLQRIAVGVGSNGSDVAHPVLDYEFACDFMAPANDSYMDGEHLLLGVYRNAQRRQKPVHLVLLSSLRDAAALSAQHSALLAGSTKAVFLQGGSGVATDGHLVPDPRTANNMFDMSSASAFFSFLQDNCLPSHTYTKTAAYAATLDVAFFQELADMDHPIGHYLRRTQIEQDVAFYVMACNEDPRQRFAPFMDQAWFLRMKTNWYENHTQADTPPVGRAVIPYLTKLVIYDGLATLGAAGDDLTDALGVFEPLQRVLPNREHDCSAQHTIYGDKHSTGVHRASLTLALRALMRGALLAP